MTDTHRIIIGMTGASGAIYGIRLLEILQQTSIETHLVISPSAQITIAQETNLTPDKVRELADVCHSYQDIAASISSGSFKTAGMIIAPCSMRTLGEIATGISSSLLSRAADVTLKERRKLVLMTRETPLTTIHLRNMETVSSAGGIIAPPVPAFYNKPVSIDDLINHTVGRILDLFSIDTGNFARWSGLSKEKG